jgi:hypothetical protein
MNNIITQKVFKESNIIIFNFFIPREQRRCFNWKNLQPLFSIENWRKNNFYKFDVVHEIKLHFIT